MNQAKKHSARHETCGSTVYTTTDHKDIEWFRRGEALQAKNAEVLKSNKAETSNANKSKTQTKSGCSRHLSGFKIYLHKYVEKPGPKKIPACYDDNDDYNFVITPNEPVDSLSMEDEHLNPILAIESDKFIKSSVENLVPNPSESEGENGCDVPACFTTFSNVLFDAEYEFDSSDNQSCSDEDVPEKIFSNPLFEEEIILIKIDPHHFNAESNLIESLLNHDSSIIPSSLKIDSLLDEFAGELTLLKSISSGIDETDCDSEEDIRIIERLLYGNSSLRPPKEFVSDSSDAEIESFSPSPIPVKDIDSFMEEIDLSFTPDDQCRRALRKMTMTLKGIL
nr:hypothetical protein [Tanacetum cinerariifolium]